jgi:hypothetical protein
MGFAQAVRIFKLLKTTPAGWCHSRVINTIEYVIEYLDPTTGSFSDKCISLKTIAHILDKSIEDVHAELVTNYINDIDYTWGLYTDSTGYADYIYMVTITCVVWMTNGCKSIDKFLIDIVDHVFTIKEPVSADNNELSFAEITFGETCDQPGNMLLNDDDEIDMTCYESLSEEFFNSFDIYQKH